MFDPADPNVRKAVLTALSPKRVDIAVDNIGGALFNGVIGMLGYAGRISVVGRSAGTVPEFDTSQPVLPPKPDRWRCRERFSPEVAQTAWKEIVRRLDAMGKRPVVDHVFSFEDVKGAFDRLAHGPLGKVVIRVAG